MCCTVERACGCRMVRASRYYICSQIYEFLKRTQFIPFYFFNAATIFYSYIYIYIAQSESYIIESVCWLLIIYICACNMEGIPL